MALESFCKDRPKGMASAAMDVIDNTEDALSMASEKDFVIGIEAPKAATKAAPSIFYQVVLVHLRGYYHSELQKSSL